MLHSELPTTLDAMERASLEFDELGRSLNLLASPLRRLPARQQPRGAASAHGAKAGAGAKSGTGAATGAFSGVPVGMLSCGTSPRVLVECPHWIGADLHVVKV